MLAKDISHPKVWKKYLLLWSIALIWFLPLSFLMEYQVACVWDPVTHFINQNRFFVGIFSDSVRSYWFSDLIGALWLKLCFNKVYLYWWFHFGGSLIVAFNVTLWNYIFISTFSLPEKKIISTGLFSTFVLFSPFYLMIGYGTFPLFLLGLALIFLINIAYEKHIYLKLAILGIISAILPFARFNLLPFGIVPVLSVFVYYKEKKQKIVRYISVYIIFSIVTYYAMNVIGSRYVKCTGNMLSVDTIYNIIVSYLKFIKTTLIKSFVVGVFLFFLLRMLSKNSNKFFIKKLYWIYPLFTIIAYFALRQYYATPKADYIRTIYERQGIAEFVNAASILEWDYKKYIVFPLFICSIIIVLISILKRGNKRFSSGKFEKKRVIVILIALLIGLFCFSIGSAVLMRTFSLLYIVFMCFFSAVFQKMFFDEKYIKLRFSILSSLLIFNVLITLESTVGLNFLKKEWHCISADGCKMMLSNDLKRCAEYENASEIIRSHVKCGDCVFEFISDYNSQWLPLTVSLGGRFPFTYWSEISDEAQEEVQHILIWGRDSAMHKDDLCKYKINLLDWGKEIVIDKKFQETARGEFFILYSKQIR